MMLINYKNLDFFHNINIKEKAYWLGFIYADGCIVNNSYKFTIDLKKNDENHLLKLSKIFNKELSYPKNRSTTVRLTISKKQLYIDLVNCGIKTNKSYSHNTDVLDFIPSNLINHFVRGVFDGDGHIGSKKNKNELHFNILGIEEFIIKLQSLMLSNIQDLSSGKIYLDKSIFRLEYNGRNDIMLLFNWLYKDSDYNILLERKYIKFKEIINNIIPKDRLKPPYKGVVKNYNKWKAQIGHNHSHKYIKSCDSEFEAAQWYDLEKVRLCGKEAIWDLNFPSQFNNYIKLINEGI